MRRRNILGGALLAAVVSATIAVPTAAKDKLIFDLTDPRGDDHGDGQIVYPLRTEFQKGELDLVRFTARRVSGATRFEATFAQPIRVPGREAVDDLGTQLDTVARNGFYTFNLDIYIDTDREEGSGAVATMPGRKAEVRDAWDRAIILTPRPHEAQGELRRLMVRTLADELRRRDDREESWSLADVKAAVPEDLADRVFFPTQVRVRGHKITFLVPDSFLRGPADPNWSYVVAVSGSNLVQSLDLAAAVGLSEQTRDSLMILPVSPGTWKDRFGGGRENQELQPPLIDILVPDGVRQEGVLSDYSSSEGRPARLPGVVPADSGTRVGVVEEAPAAAQGTF